MSYMIIRNIIVRLRSIVIFTGLKVVPALKFNYHPAPDYARGKAFFNVTSRYIETYSSSNNKDRQYLYSSLPLQGIVDHQEFILEQDEFFSSVIQ